MPECAPARVSIPFYCLLEAPSLNPRTILEGSKTPLVKKIGLAESHIKYTSDYTADTTVYAPYAGSLSGITWSKRAPTGERAGQRKKALEILQDSVYKLKYMSEG